MKFKELKVKIGVDSKGVSTGVNQAIGHIKRFQSSIDNIKSFSGDLFSGNFKANMQKNLGIMSQFSQGLNNAGNIMIGAGAGMYGAMAMAAKVGLTASKDFSASMATVRSAINGSEDDFNRIKTALLDYKTAYETALNPNQQAEAAAELGKAGFKIDQILGGALKGTLMMASAEGMAVGEAATIANTAMNQFKLNASDIPKIADVMASGAASSTASIFSLGEALKMGGLNAALTGQKFEDTVAILAAFDQSGLKGSDAGTSLKTMLMRLAPTSDEQVKMMDALNISFTTADGKFKKLSQIAEELRNKTQHLTDAQRAQAFQVMFGTDAIRAASLMYDLGGQGVDKWIDKVTVSGEAARMAKDKLTGFAGTVQKMQALKSTFEIKFGDKLAEKLNPMLDKLSAKLLQMAEDGSLDKLADNAATMVTVISESLVVLGDEIGKLIDWYNSLSDEQKDNIAKMIGNAPKYLIVSGGIAKITSSIADLLIAFATLKFIAPGVAAALATALGPAAAILGTIMVAGTIGWFLGNKIVELQNAAADAETVRKNLTTKNDNIIKYGEGYRTGKGTGRGDTVHQWDPKTKRFIVVPANKANPALMQTPSGKTTSKVKSSISNLPTIAPRPRLSAVGMAPAPQQTRQNININGTFRVENGNLIPVITDVSQTVLSMNK